MGILATPNPYIIRKSLVNSMWTQLVQFNRLAKMFGQTSVTNLAGQGWAMAGPRVFSGLCPAHQQPQHFEQTCCSPRSSSFFSSNLWWEEAPHHLLISLQRNSRILCHGTMNQPTFTWVKPWSSTLTLEQFDNKLQNLTILTYCCSKY